MGLHTAAETAGGHRRVENPWIYVIASMTRYGFGLLVEEGTDRRNIMWGKAPQDVLLGSEFPEIQAGRIDITNATEFATSDQSFKLKYRRVILQNMTYHQD